MSDGNALWRGSTTTGVANYEVRADTVKFQGLVLCAVQRGHYVEFEAKLLDDPSPTPQVHMIRAYVKNVDLPDRRTMVVSLVAADTGKFFQITATDDAVLPFEIVA